MLLENKIAVVTGGATGIGKAVVEKFVQEGAKVYSLSVGAEEFVTDTIVQINLDVTDREQIAQVVGNIKEKEGKIDILVNNAGVTKDGLTEKMSSEQFDFVIGINLKGTFNVTQAIAPIMVENNYGSIINIASVAGLYGNTGQVNYSASKAGVVGMTYTWAKEFPRKGANVRTNAIAPGTIETDMTKDLPEKVVQMAKMSTPLQRMGKPEELANAVLFLASDMASYVNGHVLEVSGGMMM